VGVSLAAHSSYQAKEIRCQVFVFVYTYVIWYGGRMSVWGGVMVSFVRCFVLLMKSPQWLTE
jgi:hypothetical protein